MKGLGKPGPGKHASPKARQRARDRSRQEALRALPKGAKVTRQLQSAEDYFTCFTLTRLFVHKICRRDFVDTIPVENGYHCGIFAVIFAVFGFVCARTPAELKYLLRNTGRLWSEPDGRTSIRHLLQMLSVLQMHFCPIYYRDENHYQFNLLWRSKDMTWETALSVSEFVNTLAGKRIEHAIDHMLYFSCPAVITLICNLRWWVDGERFGHFLAVQMKGRRLCYFDQRRPNGISTGLTLKDWEPDSVLQGVATDICSFKSDKIDARIVNVIRVESRLHEEDVLIDILQKCMIKQGCNPRLQ